MVEQYVAITVNNVNDTAPTLPQLPQAQRSQKNTAYGTDHVVYQAAATPDVAGDPVSWSLTGADTGLFTIDASTGEVTFNAETTLIMKPMKMVMPLMWWQPCQQGRPLKQPVRP